MNEGPIFTTFICSCFLGDTNGSKLVRDTAFQHPIGYGFILAIMNTSSALCTDKEVHRLYSTFK
jgi:hypothetical protein